MMMLGSGALGAGRLGLAARRSASASVRALRPLPSASSGASALGRSLGVAGRSLGAAGRSLGAAGRSLDRRGGGGGGSLRGRLGTALAPSMLGSSGSVTTVASGASSGGSSSAAARASAVASSPSSCSEGSGSAGVASGSIMRDGAIPSRLSSSETGVLRAPRSRPSSTSRSLSDSSATVLPGSVCCGSRGGSGASALAAAGGAPGTEMRGSDGELRRGTSSTGTRSERRLAFIDARPARPPPSASSLMMRRRSGAARGARWRDPSGWGCLA